MSVATSLSLSLENELQLESCCRFCQCTELNPCVIELAYEPNGTVRLARNAAEANFEMPCSWFVENVCSSPECVEKLLIEKRNNVLLFDGAGRALPQRARR